MKKTIILILVALIVASSSVFAARLPYYQKGDQTFTFQAGLNIPGFIWLPYNQDTSVKNFSSFFDTHLKLGGIGSIEFVVFINSYFSLGGSLGYAFNDTLQKNNLYTAIPLEAKLNYYPIQTGKFDLSLGLGAGICFNRYKDGFYISPELSLTACPKFFFNENWGIGITAGLSLVGEVYWKEKQTDTSLCGMMPVILSMSYRH